MTKIKGFGDDSLVVHIGDFFRYNSVPDWSVTLWCRPIQEKKYTKLANLPLISRGRLLNSTAPNIRRADRVITLKHGYQLTVSSLSEFPEISASKSVKDKDGVQHWVNPEDLNGYQVSEKPVTSGWNDDKTVYWNDYELTGSNSKINPVDDKKP